MSTIPYLGFGREVKEQHLARNGAPMTETCDFVMTPIKGQNGEDLVQMTKTCTISPQTGDAPPPPPETTQAPPPPDTTAPPAASSTPAPEPSPSDNGSATTDSAPPPTDTPAATSSPSTSDPAATQTDTASPPPPSADPTPATTLVIPPSDTATSGTYLFSQKILLQSSGQGRDPNRPSNVETASQCSGGRECDRSRNPQITTPSSRKPCPASSYHEHFRPCLFVMMIV